MTRAAPAKNRTCSAITMISSETTHEDGLPTFSDSSRPSSSACPSMTSASFSSRALRSPGVLSNQVSSNAFCAVLTARSTSSSVPLGISAIVSPDEGLTTGRPSSAAPSVHSPPMNICLRVMVCAIVVSRRLGAGAKAFGPPVRSGQPCRSVGRVRQEIPGPDGQPELHPVVRGGEVTAGELLELAHSVPERVAVDEQLGRGGLPAGVVVEERSERGDQLTTVLLVVPVERGQDGVSERPEGVGLLEREEEPVRPQGSEVSHGPALDVADLKGVAGLPEAPSGLGGGHGAAGPGHDLDPEP